MRADVYVGEVPGDGPDHEPIGHLAVFGQTRRAGKTTTLRTLIARAAAENGADILVFRTGRGEISFPSARSVPAFFRERVDWRGVEAVLWSFLDEKPQRYRPIIQRACEGARSLADVHAHFLREGKKASHGWVADRLQELDYYFREILPWISGRRLSTELRIEQGENVVDMEGWPATVQQLVVGATLDRLMDVGARPRPLIAVLPEAHRFIPSGRRTPAQRPAARITSEGAKLGLYLWIDSQALTGVDQGILRHYALVLQGVQTSDLEIRRICQALEAKPRQVKSLKVGDFLLSTPDGVRAVHVPLSSHDGLRNSTRNQEEPVDAQKEKQYQDRIAELEQRITDLVEDRDRERERAEANAKAAAANAVDRVETAGSMIEVARAIARVPAKDLERAIVERADGPAERERIDLHVARETPNLTVHVKEVRLEAKPDSAQGRIAMLMADGFLDKGQKQVEIAKELVARGAPDYRVNGGSRARLYEALLELAGQGFLRRSGPDWKVVPEAKARVRVVREAT